MKKRIYIILFGIVFLASCTKRVICEGVLYSRHGAPMQHTKIYFQIYGSASSYPTRSISYTTEKDGSFYFSEPVNRKYPMELEVMFSDSGSVRKSLGKPMDRTKIYQDVTLR